MVRVALGLALLAAVVGPPLLRGHARRTVEARLEEALGGTASVGEVERLTPRVLILTNLEVTGTDLVPLIERLRIERVTLRAPSWRTGLLGLHDEMRLEALELVAGPDPAPAADAFVEPRVAAWPSAHFVLEGATLRVPGEEDSAALALRGDIVTRPAGPTGELRFRAPRLPIGPLAAVASLDLPEMLQPLVSSTVLQSVSGRVALAETRARISLSANGGRLGLAGAQGPIDRVEVAAVLGFDGTSSLDLDASAPWARELRLGAARERGEGWLIRDAGASGVDASLLPSLHPALAEWQLSGTADGRLVPRTGEAPALLELAAQLTAAEGPAAGGGLSVTNATGRLSVHVEGEPFPLRFDDAVVHAAALTWTGDGESRALRDLDARVAGRVESDARLAWTGLAASAAGVQVKGDDAVVVEGLDLRAERGSFDVSADASSQATGVRVLAARVALTSEGGEEAGASRVDATGDASWLTSSPASAFTVGLLARAAELSVGSGDRTLREVPLLESTLALTRAVGESALHVDADALLGDGWGRLAILGSLGDSLDLNWSWDTGDPARVLASALGDAASGLAFGSLSATGRVSGDAVAPATTGRLQARDLAWTVGEGVSVGAPSPAVEFAWPTNEGDLRFVVPPAPGTVALPSAAVPLTASATGRWSPGRMLQIDQLHVEAGSLGSGRASSEGAGDRGRLVIEDASLGPWAELLGGAASRPSGASVSGRLDADLRWRLDGAGSLVLDGDSTVEQFGVQSGDGSLIVQGASGRFDLEARGSSTDDFQLDARSSDFGGFEALWGATYGDWSERRARLDLTARSDGSEEAGLRVAIDLDAENHLMLHLREGGRAGRIDAEFGSLSEAWERWLAGPLESAGPWLALHPAGAAELHADLATSEAGGSLTGRLSLRSVDASWDQPELRVQGGDLELPLALTWSGRLGEGRFAGPPAEGRLAFDGLTVGRLVLAPFESRLALQGDSVEVVEDLKGSVFGGRVSIAGLAATGLLGSEALLDGRLGLTDLDLSIAGKELGLPPVVGSLEANFTDLQVTSAEMRLRGKASAAVFGGSVETDEIVMARPFSPTPETRLSLLARDLDLARLTAQVGFGLVTGRLEGRVEDLTLQAATPVAFSASFETVQREGVPQVLSVQAAENITALGSGGSAGVFDRTLLRHFNRYRYARAGFAAELHHGVILLHGLEERGRRELFVKGRPPLRLDVVNADPGRALSFQGLLQRVNNLNLEDVRIQAGASASSNGTQR